MALTFAVTALLCLIGAAKAQDAAFAFHAYLGAGASITAVFIIFNHYFNSPTTLPPQEIDGNPYYQLGPIKFGTYLAMFWGIAGFTVGLWAALELAYPALNLDLPWTNFGRIRPPSRRLVELVTQHSIWLVIAWWTGGAWVLYFADAPTLVKQLATFEAPSVAYIWIGILTFTTYALAGHMREQVCVYMCPWPRIQAALTDEWAL